MFGIKLHHSINTWQVLQLGFWMQGVA